MERQFTVKSLRKLWTTSRGSPLVPFGTEFAKCPLYHLRNQLRYLQWIVTDLSTSFPGSLIFRLEIHEMRKIQMKKLKNARKDGKRVYFSRSAKPDKLYINGKYVKMKNVLSLSGLTLPS